ncbi:hypothetical protein [Brevundimonas diminuta]|uniref:hypothetical protein n=1 Tax=Brevundimonas diminuta TaxID=293 RepID=UPI0006802F2C|nr:hypothetical protein [Brevundimonas diminuta]WQE44499.1 hypothetical protein U0020_13030 [Brevundimonas diminuta]SUW17010.1 Uncharacterised protein [Brevundimonas diminuta]
MASLSNAAQDRLIRASWPTIRTVIAGERLAIWRGRIQGLSRPYAVEIVYARNRHGDPFRYDYAPFPEVTVVDPPLEPRTDDPDDPIPHIYTDPARAQPVLCLFDPRAGGWSRDCAIADTILPWTASWLRFYEAWHATGVWMGGSAPHGPELLTAPAAREEETPQPKASTTMVRRQLFAGVSHDALLAGTRPGTAASVADAHPRLHAA